MRFNPAVFEPPLVPIKRQTRQVPGQDIGRGNRFFRPFQKPARRKLVVVQTQYPVVVDEARHLRENVLDVKTVLMDEGDPGVPRAEQFQ